LYSENIQAIFYVRKLSLNSTILTQYKQVYTWKRTRGSSYLGVLCIKKTFKN